MPAVLGTASLHSFAFALCHLPSEGNNVALYAAVGVIAALLLAAAAGGMYYKSQDG